MYLLILDRAIYHVFSMIFELYYDTTTAKRTFVLQSKHITVMETIAEIIRTLLCFSVHFQTYLSHNVLPPCYLRLPISKV